MATFSQPLGRHASYSLVILLRPR